MSSVPLRRPRFASDKPCGCFGSNARYSVVTGEKKHAGLIRKYGLNMSRQAFREKAADIGFVKVCTQPEIFVLSICADKLQYR